MQLHCIMKIQMELECRDKFRTYKDNTKSEIEMIINFNKPKLEQSSKGKNTGCHIISNNLYNSSEQMEYASTRDHGMKKMFLLHMNRSPVALLDEKGAIILIEKGDNSETLALGNKLWNLDLSEKYLNMNIPEHQHILSRALKSKYVNE